MAQDPHTVYGTSRQKVRMSEALLADLYQNIIRSPRQVSAVRGVKIFMLVSVVSAAAFIATLFYNYNTFIMLREDVSTQHSNLEAAIQRRSNLFANLVKLTLNHAALKHSIYSHAADVRAEILHKTTSAETPGTAKNGGKSGADWNKVLTPLGGETGTETALGRLLAIVEQYPNVRSSETYKTLMSALVEMEDRIVRAREEYNGVVRAYNTATSRFPWSLLARWLDFRLAEYFDGRGSAAPVISPVLFQELLPYVAVGGDRKPATDTQDGARQNTSPPVEQDDSP
ncbi:MAG: hypothetical protein FD149_1809 [Rhodospirillaceae bacterium]|nr:MAG: hypothetical protein FD149_1809 [Rhodospirillaceae bacterium]